MASIDKLPSGKWKARWRAPDRRQRSRVFARKVDAERFLVSVEHEKLSGAYVDPRDGRITFYDYAEAWRKIQQHRPSTAEQVETMLRGHAYPAFGDRSLNSIRPSELQTWVKSLEDKLAPATIEVVARHAISVFRSAVRDRVIASSPADGLKLPAQAKAEIVPLAVDQVLAIVDSIQGRYAAMVMLMAGSGLRPAEAMGLTNDRVDWVQRSVRVDRQMVTVGGVAQFGPPKTDSSVRTIPLPTFLIETLSEHIREHGLGEHSLVFTDAKQQPIRRNRFGEVWRQAMKPLDFECKGPHQLRHHYASLLIQNGESFKVVQSRMGHASASETLDTYAHLWPDSDESTRAAVESAYLLRSSRQPGRSLLQ